MSMPMRPTKDKNSASALSPYLPPGWLVDRPSPLAPISLLLLFGATASVGEPRRSAKSSKPEERPSRFWEFRTDPDRVR